MHGVLKFVEIAFTYIYCDEVHDNWRSYDFLTFSRKRVEQGHESGLAEHVLLIKDRALCSIYYQGLGGKDDFWAEERRTSDFMIPKCNLLGKISLPRELNNSKANNIPGINVTGLFLVQWYAQGYSKSEECVLYDEE